MAKHTKYSLALCLSVFCFCLLSSTPIKLKAWSQDKSSVLKPIKTLQDPDDNVRNNASYGLKQTSPEANAMVPKLIEKLKDGDRDVRWIAAKALGKIGPAAKDAVPTLMKALKDQYEDVRFVSRGALVTIGSAAVPALVTALKSKNEELRRQAAEILGNMGSKAISAKPALIEALEDQNGEVRSWALKALNRIGIDANDAMALGKLATELRDAKAINMIEELKAIQKSLFSANLSKTEAAQDVRRAIEYLEQNKRINWWQTTIKWLSEHILISFLVVLYILWVLFWLIVYWLSPLVLLQTNRALKPLKFELPGWLASVNLPLRFLLFVGFINFHPRVLDAWVMAHISTVKERFSEKDTVRNRQIHISVPVDLNRKTIPDLTVNHLQSAFAKNIGCLLIWGEGGSGKTSIACQIAKWAMAEDPEKRLCGHVMLPVLIEHELNIDEGKQAFIRNIGRQLQDLTDKVDPVPEDLLEHLVRHRRVLVIVDHLSEMSEETRSQIKPEERDFQANALIVTSRLEETLGGVTKTVIKPLRIRRERLSPFMEAYLSHRGKSNLFTDIEFFNACSQISEMVGNRDITLLLAKLYGEQMISTKEGVTDDKLPENIPDLMLCYLNELNRNVSENRLDNLEIHRVAKVLAWECLKQKFRPAAARYDNALSAIKIENADFYFNYIEKRLRLIQKVQPAEDSFRFLLDPLVEYLAGLYLVETYGENEGSWKDLLMEADREDRTPEAIKGFLMAIRDCCIAKGDDYNIPNFVEKEIGLRAGLHPDKLAKIPPERLFRRLINQLSALEAKDRQMAAQVLGQIGPEAKAATAALSQAIGDENCEVRKSAAVALGKLGSEAKEAAPALIRALNDSDYYVREYAAAALGKIGPEAKAAVPDLIQSLKDEYSDVRGVAAWALGVIGQEAKAAVPDLIKVLKHETGGVQWRAAWTLKTIGTPEALNAISVFESKWPGLIGTIQE